VGHVLLVDDMIREMEKVQAAHAAFSLFMTSTLHWATAVLTYWQISCTKVSTSVPIDLLLVRPTDNITCRNAAGPPGIRTTFTASVHGARELAPTARSAGEWKAWLQRHLHAAVFVLHISYGQSRIQYT
jgi:hypothetical protein